MAENGYHITDERLPVIDDATGLSGGTFEVGFKNGSTRTSRRLPAGILLEAVNRNLPGPNNRKDLRKHVRTFADLALLNDDLLCLSSTCTVEFDEDGSYNSGEYVVRFDPNGSLYVWADAGFNTYKVTAKWVKKDSAQAQNAGIEVYNPNATAVPNGALRLYDDRIFKTRQELKKADFGGSIPSPLNVTYWTEQSKANPTARWRYVGYASLTDALAEDGGEPGILYRITDRGTEPDVLVQCLTNNSLATDDAYTVPANADVPVTPVTYDLENDETSPRTGGGGDAAVWAAGPQRAGQLSYSDGRVWRAKQAIGNSQTPPEDNPANYEAVSYTNEQAVQAAYDSERFVAQDGISFNVDGRRLQLLFGGAPISRTIELHKLNTDKAALGQEIYFAQLEQGLQYQYLDGASIISFHAVRNNVPGAIGTRYQLGAGGGSIQLVEPVRITYNYATKTLGWQPLGGGEGGADPALGGRVSELEADVLQAENDINLLENEVAGHEDRLDLLDNLVRYSPDGYRNILVGHPNQTSDNSFGPGSSYNLVQNSSGNTLNAGSCQIIGGSGNTVNSSGVTLLNCVDFVAPGVVGATYINNAPAQGGGGGGTPLVFSAIGSSNQSVTNQTFERIAFDTVQNASGATYDTAARQFVVPAGQGGWWDVQGGLQFQAGTTKPDGLVYLVVRVNNVRVADLFILSCPNGDELYGSSGARRFLLAAGDVVHLETWNNTNGGTVWLTHSYRCFFSMHKL